MKGAKGGQRDRKISRLYTEKNKSALQEELEAIKAHRIHDGLNLNRDENGINDLEEIEMNEEEIGILPNSEVVNNHINPQKTQIEFELKEEKVSQSKEENINNEIINEQVKEEDKNVTIIVQNDALEKDHKNVGIAIEEDQIYEENHDQFTYNSENLTETNDIEPSYDDFIETKEQEEYTKETKLEQEILFELEKMLKEDYYEIKDLEYQLKILTQKEEDAVLQEEVDDLKKQLEALLDKFDIIKKKYEELKNSKDFTDVHLFDNNYLSNLINNYKKEVQDNIVIDDLIQRVKETEDYISIMEKIVYVENEKEYLTNRVDDKKEEFSYRDTSFEELEEQYNDIDKINNEIESFSNTLDSILNDITKKIDNMGSISNKTETYSKIVPDMNRLFRAMLQFTASTMIPRTRVGNVVRAGLMVNAIHDLSHTFRTEQRTETKQVVEFVNYEKDILKNVTSLDSFVGKIDGASNSIKDMKQIFKDEFNEYVAFIPEYKELMQNMENIEKELEEKRYYLNKYNQQMKRELERNNAKILIYKNV